MSFRRVLRDRALAILQATPALHGLTMQVARVLETPPEQMPMLRIFCWIERGTQEARAGSAPFFLTTATLHFLYEAQADEAEDCESDIDRVLAIVREALLSAPAFYRNPATGEIDVREVAGHQVQVKVDGKASPYIGEGRLNLDVTYYERFEPDVQAVFVTLGAKVVPGAPGPGARGEPVTATLTIPPS